ncbi:MAG: TetR/AcrR family transcriptional regulator C-terminal ligand-binding domain-containing protein [Gammaproteobacteria bacterium]
MKKSTANARSSCTPSSRISLRAARSPGRPRDAHIDSEVIRAVLAALQSGGYRAVTIEKIALQVKRARTSLYRRWPNKRRLVAYAVVNELGLEPAPDTGSLREDLTAATDTLRRAFTGVLGRALAGLVSDMAHDAKLAESIRAEVLTARRLSMRAALQRGESRGELAAGRDLELLLDLLTAPFYFRALLWNATIGPTRSEKIVEYVLRAARP